jgi:hypothetical protein
MKQLISVLIAALFAAVSVAAVAQDKGAADKDTKAKATQKAKAGGDKAKPAKAAKKAPKKGEEAKKDK